MTDENRFQRVQWDGDEWQASDDDDTNGMPLRHLGPGLSSADLELLTLAAKAIGAQVEVVDGEEWVNLHFADGAIVYAWNSLRHSSDAFELTVRLKISVDPADDAVCAIVGNGRHVIIESGLGEGLIAATRLAVTRAAAEIGKAMS